ncbi:MAG: peptidase T [Flavobacteriales bacterium]|tara:strand:+ start:98600 stop:99847 length:1248 start_codon:yes stop_codon:yes gene_type:complete
MLDEQKIIERFISYVKIDSQSNADSEATPSTKIQWDIANKLVQDLKDIGLSRVSIDKNAYIYATLPSNIKKKCPIIGFISHFDTSPDFSGTNIKPQIIENYNGGDIVLNKKKNIVLSSEYFPEIKQYIGQKIITTDGNTLLGSDDKAGVCEIISAMEYLINNPDIKHGEIKIGFTPDEEIGRGAHKFDVAKFGADWAYTMDGSQIGELEYENFNAASAIIKIKGRIVHPGYAKGKLVNSMYYASKFINMIPLDETPEKTEGYEGFYHLTSISGLVEETELQYIVRDHDLNKFKDRKGFLTKLVESLNKKYDQKIFDIKIVDQYYNMKEKVEPHMHIVDIAEDAMKKLNIKPIIKPIRGGTDGSQLSYMGLPCPNIFAGGHNFHGKYEYLPVNSMLSAIEVICKVCEITTSYNKSI